MEQEKKEETTTSASQPSKLAKVSSRIMMAIGKALKTIGIIGLIWIITSIFSSMMSSSDPAKPEIIVLDLALGGFALLFLGLYFLKIKKLTQSRLPAFFLVLICIFLFIVFLVTNVKMEM